MILSYIHTDLNKDFVSRFEHALLGYFSEKLNMSSSYLSDLLKKETGNNAQQHIQTAIIEEAKTRLLNSEEQVNQKANTGVSPAEYRKRHYFSLSFLPMPTKW